jgi:hypothetical protein
MAKTRGFILKPFTMITEFSADVFKQGTVPRSPELLPVGGEKKRGGQEL